MLSTGTAQELKQVLFRCIPGASFMSKDLSDLVFNASSVDGFSVAQLISDLESNSPCPSLPSSPTPTTNQASVDPFMSPALHSMAFSASNEQICATMFISCVLC